VAFGVGFPDLADLFDFPGLPVDGAARESFECCCAALVIGFSAAGAERIGETSNLPVFRSDP